MTEPSLEPTLPPREDQFPDGISTRPYGQDQIKALLPYQVYEYNIKKMSRNISFGSNGI